MKRIKNFLRYKKEEIGMKARKKTIGVAMASAIVLSSTVGAAVYQDSTKAYEVRVENEVLGIVSTENRLETLVTSVEEKKSSEYNKDVELAEELKVSEVKAEKSEITNTEELKLKLEENVAFLAESYDVVIEGETIASLNSEEDVAEVIDELKKRNIEEYGTENTAEAKIVQNIESKKSKSDIESIKTVEEALEEIETGGVEVIEHEMKSGENFWDISKQYDTTAEEIEAANPDKNPNSIRAGEIVKINSPKPYVTVELVEEYALEEDIEFDITYENSGELYNDEEKVKVEGQNGKVKKNIKRISENGKEKSKEVLSEEVIQAPANKVVIKGTKERPTGIGTGSFQTPAKGYISSRFGPRWGTMHRGLDIAAPTGTSIVSSDSGKVIHASYNSGGYGYMVKVDHGNGFETLYGHCSQLYVKVGDVVSAGDKIADVGSTGNSTGPHLHFEVIEGGVKVDPEKYI